MRTEGEKTRRRELDKQNDTKYKNWYYVNLGSKNTCKKCGSEKSLHDFMPNFTFRNVCKECHRKKVSSWRGEQPELVQKMTQRSFRKSAQLMLENKNGMCTVCNKTYPACALDWHHKDMESKICNVSKLYQRSELRIKNELAKCEQVCANCHRNETQTNLEKGLIPVSSNCKQSKPIEDIPLKASENGKECKKCHVVKNVENFTLLKTGYRHSYCRKCLRQYNSKLKRKDTPTSVAYIRKQKESSPCVDCGSYFKYWIMDYDHVQGDKARSINKMQRLSIETIKNEIDKCELVCANCHRIRTYERKLKSLCVNNKRSVTNSTQIHEFNVNDIILERTLDPRLVVEFLTNYHYAGYGRPPSVLYVAKLNKEIIGVIKFTPPVRKEVATSIGEEYNDVTELDRFCIKPEYQVKNLASKMLSMAIKLLKQDTSYKVAVSFADPLEGHSGIIYKASNWTHVGVSSKSYIYKDNSNGITNKKTVYNMAVARGMSEKEFANSIDLVKINTPGKHKFIYRLK